MKVLQYRQFHEVTSDVIQMAGLHSHNSSKMRTSRVALRRGNVVIQPRELRLVSLGGINDRRGSAALTT
jgi:hypothetical protein